MAKYVASREELLQRAHERLRKLELLEPHLTRDDPVQELECLEEIMKMLTKIAKDDFEIYNDSFLKGWYHG